LASKNSELNTLRQAYEALADEKKRLKSELADAKARIKELEQASQTPSCEITNGDNRITVAIKNYSLRFVKVNSTYRMGKKKGINIALTEQQANDFHQQARLLSRHSQPIYPNIDIYHPIDTNELKSCDRLRQEQEADVNNRTVKKLLGYQWQLTQSQCRPFDETNSDTAMNCDEQFLVKKGGSLESRDATECLPEYRAESLPDMREPNTTFRLILLEP